MLHEPHLCYPAPVSVMIFSSAVQYAIRAMTCLGEQEPDRLASIRYVSDACGIPLPYLAKIVNRLARAQLVRSRRGPAGGIKLGRPAGEITVAEIIEALGEMPTADQCVLGLAQCSDKTPCPVHENWKGIREQLKESLHARSVEDLVRNRALKLRAARKG